MPSAPSTRRRGWQRGCSLGQPEAGLALPPVVSRARPSPCGEIRGQRMRRPRPPPCAGFHPFAPVAGKGASMRLRGRMGAVDREAPGQARAGFHPFVPVSGKGASLPLVGRDGVGGLLTGQAAAPEPLAALAPLASGRRAEHPRLGSGREHVSGVAVAGAPAPGQARCGVSSFRAGGRQGRLAAPVGRDGAADREGPGQARGGVGVWGASVRATSLWMMTSACG